MREAASIITFTEKSVRAFGRSRQVGQCRLERGCNGRRINNGMGHMSNNRAATSRKFQSNRGIRRAAVGNKLPRLSTHEVSQSQAEILQITYGSLKSSAKELANDAGISERAARNHLAGSHAMNLTAFFNACREIPELQQWGAAMMGLQGQPGFERELAKGIGAATKGITLHFNGNSVTVEQADK